MKLRQQIWIGALLLFTCACGEFSTPSALMPRAGGDSGEIVLVMDSNRWVGPLGQEVRNVLEDTFQVLPQYETRFDLRYIRPFRMNNMLRTSANIMYVTIFNDDVYSNTDFSEEFRAKVKANPDYFMESQKDQFASGQNIMHLFAYDADHLIEKLKAEGPKVRQYFHELEKKRFVRRKSLLGLEDGVTTVLKRDHQVSLVIPKGYGLAENTDQFFWLRNIAPDYEKNIFCYYKTYNDETVFEDERILNLRNQVGKQFIKDIDKEELFMETQMDLLPRYKTMTFNGHYGKEMRGLWRYSDMSMGGPFISYTFVDQATNRLYYLEGYVAAPGFDKRNLMREMEAMISTLKTGEKAEAVVEEVVAEEAK